MADKTYWLGSMVGTRRVGVIKVDGELYSIGESFPTENIDPKRLEYFKKAGCIGSAPFPVSDSISEGECDDCRAGKILVKELGDRIKEMDEGGEKVFANLKGQVKEKDNRIVELGKVIDGQKLRIAGLESEVQRLDSSDLKTDNEEKAALIKELKSKVKALKKKGDKK